MIFALFPLLTSLVSADESLVYHYFGKPLSLDGVDDFVDIGNADTLNPQEQMTLSVWVKLKGLGSFPLVERYTPTTGKRSYFLSIDKGFVKFNAYNDAEEATSLRTDELLSVGTWYHIAATYQFDGDAKIYINGIEKASLPAKGSIHWAKESTTLGGVVNSGNRYFYGTLQDVRVYKRGLISEEINTLYETTKLNVNTNPSYADHCSSLSDVDLEYCKIFNQLDFAYNVGNGNKLSSDSGKLAWGETRTMLSYLSVFKSTGDYYYLNKFIDHAENVLTGRDDRLGRKDWKGLIKPAWSSNNPSYSIGGARYHYVVHNGFLTYTFMSFSDLVYSSELKNNPHYKIKADLYLSEAEKTVKVFDNHWKNGPDDITRDDEGYYLWRKGDPVLYDGINLPNNQMLIMGATLFLLAKHTGNQDYSDKATRMLKVFKRSLQKNGEGYTWGYWWGWFFKGWTSAQKLSVHQPACTSSTKPACPLKKAEDVGHGSLDMYFALEAYRQGLLEESDMKKFATTFTTKLFRNEYKAINFRVDGSGICQASDCSDFKSIGGWIDLSEFDSRISLIIEDLYEKNRLASKTNSVIQLAYAKFIGKPHTVIPQQLLSVEIDENDEFMKQEEDIIPDSLLMRGNVNQDSMVDVSDAIAILNFLFQNGEQPYCLDKADVNDDGFVDVSDAVFLLNYLFLNGETPSVVFSEEGAELTPDGLEC